MPPETLETIQRLQTANDWQSVGIGGMIAILVIREVFAFILKMRNGKESKAEQAQLAAANDISRIRTIMSQNAEMLREMVHSLKEFGEAFREDAHQREIDYPPKLFEEGILLARSTNRIAGDNKVCLERIDRRVGRTVLGVNRLLREEDDRSDDDELS